MILRKYNKGYIELRDELKIDYIINEQLYDEFFREILGFYFNFYLHSEPILTVFTVKEVEIKIIMTIA